MNGALNFHRTQVGTVVRSDTNLWHPVQMNARTFVVSYQDLQLIFFNRSGYNLHEKAGRELHRLGGAHGSVPPKPLSRVRLLSVLQLLLLTPLHGTFSFPSRLWSLDSGAPAPSRSFSLLGSGSATKPKSCVYTESATPARTWRRT